MRPLGARLHDATRVTMRVDDESPQSSCQRQRQSHAACQRPSARLVPRAAPCLRLPAYTRQGAHRERYRVLRAMQRTNRGLRQLLPQLRNPSAAGNAGATRQRTRRKVGGGSRLALTARPRLPYAPNATADGVTRPLTGLPISSRMARHAEPAEEHEPRELFARGADTRWCRAAPCGGPPVSPVV